MKKNLNEELKDIKYLFNYDRGRVISEQQLFEDDQEEFDTSMDYDDDQEEFDNSTDDMELDEEMDLPVMLPGTKEKERIKVDPGTKPKQPKTPYKPKPGPKPDPKAGRESDMPTWLTFDELGIDFE